MTTPAWAAKWPTTSTSRAMNGRGADACRETDERPERLATGPLEPSGTKIAGPIVPSSTSGWSTRRVRRQRRSTRAASAGVEHVAGDAAVAVERLAEHRFGVEAVRRPESSSRCAAASAARSSRGRRRPTRVPLGDDRRGSRRSRSRRAACWRCPAARRARLPRRRASSYRRAFWIAMPAAAARPSTSSSSMSVNTSPEVLSVR